MENIIETESKKELSEAEIRERLSEINRELDEAGGVPFETIREKNNLINKMYALYSINVEAEFHHEKDDEYDNMKRR